MDLLIVKSKASLRIWPSIKRYDEGNKYKKINKRDINPGNLPYVLKMVIGIEL